MYAYFLKISIIFALTCQDRMRLFTAEEHIHHISMNLLLTPLFLGLGGQEILIIAILVLLLFGGRKIPELMKGLGKGIRSFKDGMNGTGTEETENPQAGSRPAADKKNNPVDSEKPEA